MSLDQSLSSDSKLPDPSVWKEDQQKSFLDLPNEIISHCIEYVDLPGWVALRKASRKMRIKVPHGGSQSLSAKEVLSYFAARAATGEEVSHTLSSPGTRLTG